MPRRAAAGGRRILPRNSGIRDEDGGVFEFPAPPDRISEWAAHEAADWRGLGRFEMEIKAEERSGLRVEICFAALPETVWGLHVARGDRVRLCVNSELPDIWKRFAVYHELYHLIAHSMGEYFWRQTFNPISKFEAEADMFAWAAIWPEWAGEE